MSITFVRLVALLLGVVFAWAAVAKPLHWTQWRRVLDNYGWTPPLRAVAAVGVPLAEASAAACLLAGPRAAGAALVLALLAGSSLAVARLRASAGDRIPCGCFGHTSERDARWILGRNALLGVLSAVVLLSANPTAAPLRMRLGSDLIPALLVLAGVLVGGWTLWRAGAALRGRPRV
jgi:hypothetical protein